MATALMNISKVMLIWLHLCVAVPFSGAQDTNVLARMPQIAQDSYVNRYLEACGMRPIAPIYQTNDISYIYRVIILRPIYMYTETQDVWIRRKDVDLVVFKMSGQTGPSKTIPGSERRNLSDIQYAVTRHRISSDKDKPHLVFMQGGKWQAEDIEKWFALIHRSEVFSLPEIMSIQRDNDALVYSAGGGTVVIFERSRYNDYTVILRNLYQSLVPRGMLEELSRMFPKAGFTEGSASGVDPHILAEPDKGCEAGSRGQSAHISRMGLTGTGGCE